jgi:resuscitation-promoting factor RpfB
MASRGGLSGLALAEIAAGVILAWSGIENASIASTLRSLTGGQKPAADTGGQALTTAPTTAAPGSTAAAGDTGASSATAAQAQAIARLLAAPYGWSTGQQWADLVSLWNKESGWNRLADNPSSGAYGIPQSLPGSKMGALANPPTSSATAQIAWGLSYIRSTYGSPTQAWAHETANNWY